MSGVNVSTVTAYLILDTSRYRDNLQNAVRDLKILDSPAMSASEKMQVLANSMNTFGSNMSKLLTVPLVELGKEAVSTFASFDDSMRQVIATMSATGDEAEALTEAAKNAGATTRYTAVYMSAIARGRKLAQKKTDDNSALIARIMTANGDK